MIRLLGRPMGSALVESVASSVRRFDRTAGYFRASFAGLGPDAEMMLSRVLSAAVAKPDALPFAFGSLQRYLQVRYMYDHFELWDPAQAASPQEIA